MQNEEAIWRLVDAKKTEFAELSDTIWGMPELAYAEHRSAAEHTKMLHAQGFRVTENLAGIPTAMMGEAGEDGPVIAILGEGEPLAARDIVARAKLDKVTVSRAAKSLENRELVARVAHGADQRSHHLVLTPEGRALYDEVAPEALAMEQRLLSSFDEWESGALKSLLRRIQAAAEACDR